MRKGEAGVALGGTVRITGRKAERLSKDRTVGLERECWNQERWKRNSGGEGRGTV